MNARVIPFRRPGAVADLAASLAAATRRGDVIGEILGAARGRDGASRSSKVSDATAEDRLAKPAALRRRRCAALLLGLIELGEHGVGDDSRLLAAMDDLLAALDADVAPWAKRRFDEVLAHRGPRTTPVPMRDLGKLRAKLVQMRGEDAMPPSGSRALLAADARYVAIRREALDAIGAVTGDLAPGVRSLGGVYAPGAMGRDLATMVSELSVEVCYPSRGNVPRMARQAAQAALSVAERVPGLLSKAETAAGLLERLAVFVERGGAL